MKDLLSLIENDKIDTSEVLHNIERMRKQTQLKKKYHEKVKIRKDDNRPYLYVNRKQIIGNSEEELFDKLYTLFYGAENYTLEDVFPKWLRFKRDNTPIDAKSLRI